MKKQCRYCKDEELIKDTSMEWSKQLHTNGYNKKENYSGIIIYQQYFCNKCGYTELFREVRDCDKGKIDFNSKSMLEQGY